MSPEQLQTIEILKAATPLFESGSEYLFAVTGALGAIGGALATYFPSLFIARHQQRELRKSTAFQLHAEIRATLELVRHRRYIEGLRHVVAAFDREEITTSSYLIQIPDERFIVFKSN